MSGVINTLAARLAMRWAQLKAALTGRRPPPPPEPPPELLGP